MKRPGFTLLEMLIVVAVVVVLVALLNPAVHSAYRSVEVMRCAWNLRDLYAGMMLERQDTEEVKQYPFPTTDEWPDAPMSALENGAAVVRCPIDTRADTGPNSNTGRENPEDVLYQSAMGNHFIPFSPGYSCVMRRGADADGNSYTEYAIEENPYYEAAWSGSIYGYSENDGVWRIYDARHGKRSLVLVSYTCGFTTNNLWYKGEMLWTNLASHVGQSMSIGSNSFTSYGLNKNLSQQPRVSSGAILALDFRDIIVDPTAADIQDQLEDAASARHDGQHNVLFADGSVRLMGTASLYPQLFPALWRP